MIEKIKQHIKDIVDITIQYVNYNFVSNYSNCLVICIKKDKTNKKFLVFLTEEGVTRSVDLEDCKNIKVSVKPICQI